MPKIDRKRRNKKTSRNWSKAGPKQGQYGSERGRKGAKTGQKTAENVLEKFITTQPRVDDHAKINKCHKKKKLEAGATQKCNLKSTGA